MTEQQAVTTQLQTKLRRQPAHPGAVAGDGVDLAVVREQPERLRQRPARRGIGGEALVEHHRAAGQVRAPQVGVELGEAVGQDHALVADGMRGQRHHVEIPVHAGIAQALLGAAPRQVQRVLELFRGRARAVDGSAATWISTSYCAATLR